MTDLAAWVLAQIEADEAAARAAKGRVEFRVIFDAEQSLTPQQVAHIARHDPARVLAECAARRAVVELHKPEKEGMGYIGGGEYGGIDPACSTCGTADEYDVPWPCQTLRLLAQPYADRPGFDPAWKVET